MQFQELFFIREVPGLWKWNERASRLVVPDSLRSHGLQTARLPYAWNSSGKNTGVGSHALLQGIFPIQGVDPCLSGLLHWQTGSLLSVWPEKPPNIHKQALKGLKIGKHAKPWNNSRKKLNELCRGELCSELQQFIYCRKSVVHYKNAKSNGFGAHGQGHLNNSSGF